MHILTLEEVQTALQECWNLLKPELKDKDIKTFKLTNFEVMESGLNDYFSGIPMGVPSAGALLNLLTNGDSKRNKAVAIIALFILLKKDLITNDEKQKLLNRKAGKSPLSDYTNRVTLLTKLKEYLTEPTNDVIVETSETVPDRKFSKFYLSNILAAGVVILIFGFWFFNKKSEYTEGRDFTWEIITQPNDNSSPCEITLKYDLSKISYKNAYIDFGDRVLRELKNKEGKVKYTIPVPQGRKYVLKIDDQVFVKRGVIKTDGWIAKVNDLYFTQTSINGEGRMHLSPERLFAPILKTGEYYVAYQKIDDFDYDLNNVVFETRVKNPEDEGGISCFDLSVDLNGFLGDSLTVISFNLLKPGCTSWANLRVGEVSLDPDNYDLSKLGIDLSDWKTIRGVLREKSFRVYLEDNLLYEVPFMADLGKLNFIQLLFKGSGSVDYFKLSDQSGHILVNDTF